MASNCFSLCGSTVVFSWGANITWGISVTNNLQHKTWSLKWPGRLRRVRICISISMLMAIVTPLLVSCGSVNSSGGSRENSLANDPYRHENLRYIFDDNALPKVTITLSQEALQKKLDLFDQNSRHETEVRASFKFDKNGVVDDMNSVGFRIKGNTSRARIAGNLGEAFNPENPQWHQTSFSIDFNEYIVSQEFRGLKKITMRYFSNDPTFVRIAYAENLMREFGVWTTPLASYAQLYLQIEGQDKPAYFGIYQLTEAVDSTYIMSRFADRELGFMWKCTICTLTEPLDDGAVGVEFIHQQDDQLSVRPQYDLKIREFEVEEAKGMLREFIKNLNNLEGKEFENWIEKSFDVDLFLKSLAARIVMGDWDSHWVNNNNYYLYFHTANQKVYFIPHDFDAALARSGIVEDPIMRNPFVFGGYHMGKPLVYKLLNTPRFRARYRNFLKELVDENNPYFHKKASHRRVEQILSVIDPKGDNQFIKNDTNSSQVIYDTNFALNKETHFNILPQKGKRHNHKVDFYAARTMAILNAIDRDKYWEPISNEDLKSVAQKPLAILGQFNDWNLYNAWDKPEKFMFKKGVTESQQEIVMEFDEGMHEFYLVSEGTAEGTYRAHRMKNTLSVKVKPDFDGNLVHDQSHPIGVYPVSQDEMLRSITLIVPVKGQYKLVFDYSKPDRIKLSARLEKTNVSLAKLRETEEAKKRAYLRGDFNEWGTSAPFESVGGDQLYKVSAYIRPGEHKFKIADAAWDKINIGSPPGVKVVLIPGGKKHTVAAGENAADLFIQVEKAGFYEFLLDFKNKKKPMIGVRAK